MKNRTVVAFETLEKSNRELQSIQSNFYPAGTVWLVAFSGGRRIITLSNGDSAAVLSNQVIGKPDLILVKDTELSEQELDVLATILADNELYVIHHYSSGKINASNSKAIKDHPRLGPDFRSSITQSHFEGEFYYKELVAILGCVLSGDQNRKGQDYRELIEELHKNRFPNRVMESKLELLHQCLDYAGSKNAVLKEDLQAEYGTAFRDFQRGLTPDNHFERLTALRNGLLPE